MSTGTAIPRQLHDGVDLTPFCAECPEWPCARYARRKVLLDRLLAMLLLIPGLPIIGLVIVLVRLTSRGPGIYRQVRVGRCGRTFHIYKVRTMYVDAEGRTGAVWTQDNDPRITPLGRLLRKSHLDELPQLFNVLRGDMSLVGPRPERPEFVGVLAHHIPGYGNRLAALPGITGLAQINLPPDTDLDSVRRKQVLDLEYVRTASLWLDLRLLLCTQLRLLGLKGDVAARLMRLDRRLALAGESRGAEASPATAGSGTTPEEIAKQASRQSATNCGGDVPCPNRSSCTTNHCLLSVAPRSGNGKAKRPSPANPEIPARVRASSVVSAVDRESSRNVAGVFTVDVEDYFHVTAFEGGIARDRWGEFPSRVVKNTHRVLDLLARHDVRGTFFVLGWVADRYPELVREIHAAGHEIGSHSYWHRRIYQQTPEEFRRDLQQSRDVLTDLIGQRVVAYRAPCFSIIRESLWALEVLAEEGFEVDSSIFPIHHDRYGIPDSQRAPHRIVTSAGPLWQFPLATHRIAGLNVPVSGGGYFRALPVRWTIRSLAAIRRQTGHPFVFYIHPWELDPEQPRLRASSKTARLRHYLNLASTEQKLDQLLRRFSFGRLDQAVATLNAPEEFPSGRTAAVALADA